jgi:hypothetical protein
MIQYFINNEFIFYPMLVATAGIIGYSFFKSVVKSSYVEKGVQTDSW